MCCWLGTCSIGTSSSSSGGRSGWILRAAAVDAVLSGSSVVPGPLLRACRVIVCDTVLDVSSAAACLPALPVCRSPCSCCCFHMCSASPPHGVCIHSCVDAFTHAHTSDPCPLPVHSWQGLRQGAGVWQACFRGSVGAPGYSTHTAVRSSCVAVPWGVAPGWAGHMRGRRRHCTVLLGTISPGSVSCCSVLRLPWRLEATGRAC
jgi:hypothetical protein